MNACFLCLTHWSTLYPADDRHHIVYGLTGELTIPLCRPHHVQITALNIERARKFGRTLSDKERADIWLELTANEDLHISESAYTKAEDLLTLKEKEVGGLHVYKLPSLDIVMTLS